MWWRPVQAWARRALLLLPRALGGWEGASYADICAQLTGTPARFWAETRDARGECAERIERHGAAVGEAIEHALLIVVLWQVAAAAPRWLVAGARALRTRREGARALRRPPPLALAPHGFSAVRNLRGDPRDLCASATGQRHGHGRGVDG